MFGELESFAWEMPGEPGVFSWEQCRLWRDHSEGRQLVTALVRRFDAPMSIYHPLSGSLSLYRILAAVDPTEEGILEFVRQYGSLGEGVEIRAELPDEHSALVEPLEKWRHAVVWLAEEIRVWELIQRRDYEGLGCIIKWERDSVRYVVPTSLKKQLGAGPILDNRGLQPLLKAAYVTGSITLETAEKASNVIAATTLGDDRFSRLKPGDVLQPARYWLLDGVNRVLGMTTQPALLWDEKRGQPILCHYPRSLLGAAYLQFAAAILSDRVSRVCQICGRPFEVTNLASRNDRLTCSNTCRTRAYRDRQKKAQELHDAGKKPREIAKQLGTTVEKVNTWIVW
jgi:hypothetical protein